MRSNRCTHLSLSALPTKFTVINSHKTIQIEFNRDRFQWQCRRRHQARITHFHAVISMLFKSHRRCFPFCNVYSAPYKRQIAILCRLSELHYMCPAAILRFSKLCLQSRVAVCGARAGNISSIHSFVFDAVKFQVICDAIIVSSSSGSNAGNGTRHGMTRTCHF